MMTRIRIVAYAILILLFALQFIPVNRDNPKVEADLIASPEVKSILKKSCYDCHSNETNYPFYSYIFPISFFLKNHINEGREELNFSNWESLSNSKKAMKAGDIIEQIEDREMPLNTYTLIHWSAKLTKKEIHTLRSWAEETEKKYESRN